MYWTLKDLARNERAWLKELPGRVVKIESHNSSIVAYIDYVKASSNVNAGIYFNFEDCCNWTLGILYDGNETLWRVVDRFES